jgi:carboxylesterase type B
LRYYNTFLVTESLFGADVANAVPTFYPSPTDSGYDGRLILSEILTDSYFYCPLLYTLDALHAIRGKEDSQPTYMYHYEHVVSTPCQPDKYPYCKDIACHAWELPVVFGNLICETFDGTTVTTPKPTDDEQKLSLGMRSAWVNFAYTGNPNKGPMQATVIRPFPLYDSTNHPLVQLDYPGDPKYSELYFNLKNSVCSNVWDKFYDAVSVFLQYDADESKNEMFTKLSSIAFTM